MRKKAISLGAKGVVDIIKPLMAFVCIIIVGVFSVWSIMGVFNDEFFLFRYLNFFGYFVPVVTLSIVFFLLIFVSKKSGVISLLIGFPVLVLPYSLVGFDVVEPELDYGQISSSESKKSSVYKIVSFSKMSSNRNFSLMSDSLNCDEYDVVFFQEALGLKEYLRDSDDENWSRCNYVTSNNGFFAVLSKYPVELVQDHHYFAVFDVNSPSGIFSALNLRLDKALDEKGYQVQREELNGLVGNIQELFVGKPVLAVGDFNSTPFNMAIQKMSRLMDYAGGVGLYNFTFPAAGRRAGVLLPILSIDHVFKSGMNISQFKVDGQSYGSDHYPIAFYVSL